MTNSWRATHLTLTQSGPRPAVYGALARLETMPSSFSRQAPCPAFRPHPPPFSRQPPTPARPAAGGVRRARALGDDALELLAAGALVGLRPRSHHVLRVAHATAPAAEQPGQRP